VSRYGWRPGLTRVRGVAAHPSEVDGVTVDIAVG
jgi:hypothetical protein